MNKKPTPAKEQEAAVPLPGQMDIFRYIKCTDSSQKPAPKRRKSRRVVPGQITLFEYMDHLEEEAVQAERNEALPIPGQVELLEYLNSVEAGEKVDTELDEKAGEWIDAESGEEEQDNEGLLILGDGALSIGRIMRVLHVSAVEAQRLLDSYQTRGNEITEK